MRRFVLILSRRLLGIAVVAWAVTFGTFALFRAGIASPAGTAQINAQLGQGGPFTWQYANYLARLLHGDLGQSLTTGLSVNTVLWRALPPTLSLMIGAMILWLTAGAVVGTVSALRPRSWADRIVTGAALGALVIPTFVLALLALSFSTYLSLWGDRWMQPGYVGFSQSPAQWLGRMILPWIAVAATQAATTAKLTRSAILDVLGEDYIRTARAKGLGEWRIFLRHTLRPASISLISSASAGFGVLLGYAAIVDWVFALGGIGQQLLSAARNSDVMIVVGVVLATAILVSLVNLVADVCLAVLDPRVHVT